MLSLVTNTTDVTSGSSAPTFKKKCTTGMIKFADINKGLLINNAGQEQGILSVMLASVAVNLAKLFNNSTALINESDKISSKPKIVDEYKDGKLFKTTSFSPITGLPEWVIQYSPKGEDIITEFYPDGKKMRLVQYFKDDTVNNVLHFDESGKITKDERYNSDKTLLSIMSYEEDKTILESYDHGILRTAMITYNNTANKVEITYNENKQIISAREEGDGYETYFAYSNGKRIWSGTYYLTDGPVAYKRVEYDDSGAPKVAYLYADDQTLYGKTEFKDEHTRINTKFTKDGQIKAIENINTKTGKVSRQYRKVQY